MSDTGFFFRKIDDRDNAVALSVDLDWLLEQDPLQASITKWKTIVSHLENITEEFTDCIDKGQWTCGLCLEYYDNGCMGCPIRIRTGEAYCRKTPYRSYVIAVRTEDMLKYAREEVKFLEAL